MHRMDCPHYLQGNCDRNKCSREHRTDLKVAKHVCGFYRVSKPCKYGDDDDGAFCKRWHASPGNQRWLIAPNNGHPHIDRYATCAYCNFALYDTKMDAEQEFLAINYDCEHALHKQCQAAIFEAMEQEQKRDSISISIPRYPKCPKNDCNESWIPWKSYRVITNENGRQTMIENAQSKIKNQLKEAQSAVEAQEKCGYEANGKLCIRHVRNLCVWNHLLVHRVGNQQVGPGGPETDSSVVTSGLTESTGSGGVTESIGSGPISGVASTASNPRSTGYFGIGR